MDIISEKPTKHYLTCASYPCHMYPSIALWGIQCEATGFIIAYARNKFEANLIIEAYNFYYCTNPQVTTQLKDD